MGTAEVELDILLEVAALAGTQQEHRPAVDLAETAEDGAVVGVAPVAIELEKIRRQPLDVVLRIGPLRMTRELHALPGRQVREDTATRLIQTGFQQGDAVADVDVMPAAEFAQVGDLLL